MLSVARVESHHCVEADSHLMQGSWCEVDSGRGTQAPWLRNAISEGMQASLEFGQFSLLEGGKDFNCSGFSPSITEFRQSLPGAACSLIYNHQEAAILVYDLGSHSWK